MDRHAIKERFGIIGDSPAMQNVIDQIRLVSRTQVNILIQGESGVGKELIAHAIHEISARKHEPIITVNCGAIPEGLIESELFGAEKGAYTGAAERRKGYFEEADGGTIFLDEIGEMPASAQVRLLRVLESGEFSRVGSAVSMKTDVRVVAATNKDLAQEVRANRFREDLYYRLSTVIVNIPPLRERSGDILPLLNTFLHRYAQQYNSPAKKLEPAASELLTRYRWPGNVRELRNLAERVSVLHQGDTVTVDDLRPHLRGVSSEGTSGGLVPVLREDRGRNGETRERELVYRALLELRMEIGELKDRVEELVAIQRAPRNRMIAPPSEALVVKTETDDYSDFVEDVAYEYAADEPRGQQENGMPDAAGTELPTLADAERELIAEALKRFEGNRRLTSQALGISERTLYRKIKELEENA